MSRALDQESGKKPWKLEWGKDLSFIEFLSGVLDVLYTALH